MPVQNIVSVPFLALFLGLYCDIFRKYNANIFSDMGLVTSLKYKKKLTINIMEKENGNYINLKAKIFVYFHIDFQYVEGIKKETITNITFDVLEMDNLFLSLYKLKVLCKKYPDDIGLAYIRVEFSPNNAIILNRTKKTFSFALEITSILDEKTKKDYFLNMKHTLDKTLFRKLYYNQREYDLKIIASDVENDK